MAPTFLLHSSWFSKEDRQGVVCEKSGSAALCICEPLWHLSCAQESCLCYHRSLSLFPLKGTVGLSLPPLDPAGRKRWPGVGACFDSHPWEGGMAWLGWEAVPKNQDGTSP